MDRFECPVILKWMGGKYEMSRRLIPMFFPHDVYYEPFFGGGSIFFRKKKCRYNVINDINSELVNLYRVICNDELFVKFQNLCKHTLASRAMYNYANSYLKTPIATDSIGKDWERAVNYYYWMRTSFNGIAGAGFSTRNDNYPTWNLSLLELLDHARKKLNNVTIENVDIMDFIERYNKNLHNKKTFWYFDPPYIVADKEKYYEYNFNKEMHKEFLKGIVALNENNHKIMISYDNVDWMKQMYKDAGFQINYINMRYSSSGQKGKKNKVEKELIITNYTPIQQEMLF